MADLLDYIDLQLGLNINLYIFKLGNDMIPLITATSITEDSLEYLVKKLSCMCKLNCGSPLITVVCRTMLSHINKMCNPLQFDFN